METPETTLVVICKKPRIAIEFPTEFYNNLKEVLDRHERVLKATKIYKKPTAERLDFLQKNCSKMGKKNFAKSEVISLKIESQKSD